MLLKLIILCLIVETIQAPFKSLVCNSDDKDYGEFTVQDQFNQTQFEGREHTLFSKEARR